MDMLLEQIQYDLKDLEEAVHMMMLGFDSLNDSHGVGCLCVIESQLEKISNSLEESERRMCREGISG
ncbi:MAG TPA: hypothetical protein DD414_06120 [Lachnospiraceae bacterium]|nr:hypothetical protein [Lachnospiraceae bacterium]